jgi:hypothetical protein
MRRFMPVGLWVLLLVMVAVACPGLRVLGTPTAYAWDDPNGNSYDQDSGTGGGGGAGVSYGDPDGPQASPKSRGGSWQPTGTRWRGAAVYGRVKVGGGSWTVRDLIMGLRYYYLRF